VCRADLKRRRGENVVCESRTSRFKGEEVGMVHKNRLALFQKGEIMMGLRSCPFFENSSAAVAG